MFWLLRKFIILLSSETNPAQLAAGAFFGAWLGFIPLFCPLWFLLIFAVLLFRVNITMTVANYGFFAGMALLFHHPVSQVGLDLLQSESLTGLWTSWYNTPWLAISGYNRPSVMGGLAVGLVVGILLFPLWMVVIKQYRSKILPHLQKFWFMRMIKGSVFYRFYSSIVGS